MMGKLLFLDFLDRFFSSILYNKLLGFLISQFAIHSGMHSEAVSSLIWTLSPIIVSVGSSLLTFPLRNFLFTHFVRVRLYERIENDALKRLEEEKRYPNSEVRNESFSTAVTRMRKKCSQRQLYLMEDEAPPHDPDAVCGLIENMCHHLLHDEVRDYLRSTVDLDGFAALYNGFSVYVSSIFASVLVGASLRVTVRFIKAHASH
ncbi:hypothetical protein AGDE_15911 [Angomonas deanei]|uniref:Uncharacterized protein n=1 Tax=Angomonas deanei TaxID=59799 RepID=A0A7G2CK57_9TRYP|nr:hypothetical protein AGDE_15911 [Angomonas deanei]CAD2219341.1 hypothetical protein, conserved [Angomonas deanei]|eukprot:EPY18161.1 hypothetical protein AGDE_15911 [Angomonas deanei]